MQYLISDVSTGERKFDLDTLKVLVFQLVPELRHQRRIPS